MKFFNILRIRKQKFIQRLK